MVALRVQEIGLSCVCTQDVGTSWHSSVQWRVIKWDRFIISFQQNWWLEIMRSFIRKSLWFYDVLTYLNSPNSASFGIRGDRLRVVPSLRLVGASPPWPCLPTGEPSPSFLPLFHSPRWSRWSWMQYAQSVPIFFLMKVDSPKLLHTFFWRQLLLLQIFWHQHQKSI